MIMLCIALLPVLHRSTSPCILCEIPASSPRARSSFAGGTSLRFLRLLPADSRRQRIQLEGRSGWKASSIEGAWTCRGDRRWPGHWDMAGRRGRCSLLGWAAGTGGDGGQGEQSRRRSREIQRWMDIDEFRWMRWWW